MASHNKVIWDEGLFIRPHHFQQEARYLDFLIDYKSKSLNEFLFGFHSLKINQEYLNFGKIGIQQASGIMLDGTVFSVPAETPEPQPLTINDLSMVNQIVYLCLPLKSDGVTELSANDKYGQTRLSPDTVEIKDTLSSAGDYAAINVAKVNLKLMLESEDRSGYNCLAIAKIVDRQADNKITLDEHFYPVSTSISAIPQLGKFLGEISGLMRERSKNIAERVGSPSQAGVADVTDFMMLLALNRFHPYFLHLARMRHVHPERLYSVLVATCGELSTFINENKLPEEFAAYNHELPHISFIPLQNILKQILGTVMQARALPIDIVEQQYGIHSATLTESNLIDTANFILAVKADMPAERIRQQFTQQTKISSSFFASKRNK